MRRRIVYSFHLPKCAGGTVAASAAKMADYRLLTHLQYTEPLALDDLDRNLWIDGHTSFGLHQLHGTPAAYITILRDPVDRLISEFFFLHAHQEFFIPENERLTAFIESTKPQPHLNYYCLMFSTYCFDKQAAISGQQDPLALLKLRQQRKDFLALRTDFRGVDMQESFRKSVANISSHFEFVGDYGPLPDTIGKLERRYGLAIDMEQKIHATPTRPKVAELPADVRKDLERKTEADRELMTMAIAALGSS